MPKALQVLLIDDSEEDAFLLLRHLRRHDYEVTSERVDTAAALRAALARREWDIALCDYVMPELRADDALRILRADAPGLPVITVSGNVGEEYAVSVMRAGAKDYVRKDNLTRLIPAIERELADAIGRRERRDLEHALRDVEIREHNLFATMEQGVVYQDASGAITAANPAATRILGLSLDQLQGRTSVDPRWRTVREDGSPFPGHDHPAMVSLVTGRPTRGVLMGVGVAGSEDPRWILVDAVPEFRPGEDAPYRVFTTFTDVTARRRAEEQLRRSERRFRLLFENAPDAIFTGRLNGVVQEANAAACAMLGRSLEDIRRIGRAGIVDASDTRLAGALAEGDRSGRFVGKLTLRRADGTTFPAAVTAVMLADAPEAPFACVIVRDVTERQRAEAANRELEAFSDSVSHDLRAPLRHIQGFVEAIAEKYGAALPEDVRCDVDRVRTESRRMSRMIEALLQLSRIGRAALDRRPVDLSRLVAAAWADLRHDTEDRGVELVVGDLPEVSGDAVLLRQVFANLLDNALMFTRQTARPRIEVGVERRDGHAVIVVRDNGVGFAPRLAGSLFDVFQRPDGESDREGSGVGLSIVKCIVEKHGGTIRADRSPDGGATFSFTLAPS